MKIKRRILAMLLVLIMCVSTLATTAFAYAEDQDPESESTSQETTAPEEPKARFTRLAKSVTKARSLI